MEKRTCLENLSNRSRKSCCDYKLCLICTRARYIKCEEANCYWKENASALANFYQVCIGDLEEKETCKRVKEEKSSTVSNRRTQHEVKGEVG